MEIGSHVRVRAGNAAGRTGVVRAIADDGLLVVESDATGQLRRFALEMLELEPGNSSTSLTNHGSGATPVLEAVLPNGSGATPNRMQVLRDEVVAVLPHLESLRDRLSATGTGRLRLGHPLSRGWLNDEPRRMRYCYRNDKGAIVCTRVKPDELNLYRDRLQLGRVLAALDQVICFGHGSNLP